MSVRKIPKNYRNLTGLAASQKASKPFFESTLERDFLTLLDFDPYALSYDVQPVSVPWFDTEGDFRNYTPDVLVEYRSKSKNNYGKRFVLYEVKYRSELTEKWLDLKPKFQAAVAYAKERDWKFKLITDKEIKTVYMENARFLLGYMNNELCQSEAHLLLSQLKINGACSIQSLLNATYKDRWNQAEILPALWQLIGDRTIKTDLNTPLTMSSEIWFEGALL